MDPVKNGDSLLVTFDDDGSAVPIYPDEQSIHHQRAKTSIAFYHLDHPEIKRAEISSLQRNKAACDRRRSRNDAAR